MSTSNSLPMLAINGSYHKIKPFVTFLHVGDITETTDIQASRVQIFASLYYTLMKSILEKTNSIFSHT